MVGQHLARGLGRAGSLEGTGTVGGPCRAVPCRVGQGAAPGSQPRGTAAAAGPALPPPLKAVGAAGGILPSPVPGKEGVPKQTRGSRVCSQTRERRSLFSAPLQ